MWALDPGACFQGERAHAVHARKVPWEAVITILEGQRGTQPKITELAYQQRSEVYDRESAHRIPKVNIMLILFWHREVGHYSLLLRGIIL